MNIATSSPPTDLALRQAVIDTCRAMTALGINQGTSGNVSVRSGTGILITPSGVAYEHMEPMQIVAMDLDGGYWGDWLPSTEWRMHLDLYRARPEAKAVVHAHSIHATALSCLRADIPAFHYMVAAAGGTTLRCAEYATFGSQGLSDAMLKALEARSACLLANHGMIAFGASLDQALWLASEIETLCHQYVIARSQGDPVTLSEEEMEDVLACFQSYGKQAGEREPDAPLAPPPRRG